MASTYLCSAFSLNMLPAEQGAGALAFARVGRTAAARLAAAAVPAVGHEDTARVVAADLAMPVTPFSRATVTLRPGDACLVAQYVGPRLEAGATALPPTARIDYVLVTFAAAPAAAPAPSLVDDLRAALAPDDEETTFVRRPA